MITLNDIPDNNVTWKAVADDLNENFKFIIDQFEEDALKTGGYLSVLSYGAKGDGVTNDRNAVYNAIVDGITKGKSVFFPSGTYKINSAIEITGLGEGDYIGLIGDNAILDLSAVPDSGRYLHFVSTYSNPQAISVEANKGDRTISVDTAINLSGIKRGDIIYIYNRTVAWKYTSTFKGEMQMVRDVTPTSITTYSRLIDNYQLADTNVKICRMPEFQMRGIELIGNKNRVEGATSYMLHLYGFKNVRISECKTTGNDRGYFRIAGCFNFWIYKCFSYDANRSGSGYVVNCESSQYGIIDSNIAFSQRHFFTSNFASTFFNQENIPSRWIRVRGNTITAGWTDTTLWNNALDTHAESEYIVFENNELENCGVQLRDGNCMVLHNRITYTTDSQDAGIFISNPTDGYYIIRQNEIIHTNNSSTGVGIQIFSNNRTSNISNIIIENNSIEAPLYSIFITATNVLYPIIIKDLHINGNKIISLNNTSVPSVLINGYITITELNIFNNYIYSEKRNSFVFIEDDLIITRMYFKGNRINENTAHAAANRFKNIAFIEFSNNNINQVGGGAFAFQNADMVIMKNNTWEGSRSYDIQNTVTKAIMVGNVNISSVGGANNAGTVVGDADLT